MTAIGDKPLYRFANFLLDPARRVLLQGDQRLELPPRAFDTLLLLVSEKGNLVEKDRLMRSVWPDTIVEENNLSQAIYLIRRVLRDGEGGVKYIETVPRQGFRFVEPVRELDIQVKGVHPTPASIHAPSGPENSGNFSSKGSSLLDVPRASSNSPRIRPILGAVLLLLIFSAVWVWRSKHNQGADSNLRGIRSLAVLPLQNLSNDPEQEYFADGMTDELITDLAQVHDLRVVSKTSIMQYKGARRSLPEIGRELGVDAVIEGSVLHSGDRVRITAQLIRTATDSHLWANSYEGELKDVLSLQAAVAEEITGEVRLKLTDSERERLRRSRPVNPQAYEAYLRGRFAWNRRDMAGFERAVQYFNQGIAIDPDFSLAYSGLADCYILMALNSGGLDKIAKARTAAMKALSLDNALAEAHTSLAAVKIFADWDWAGAEVEFKYALELNPDYAPAHHWYGNILLGPLGRHEEAIAALKRAQTFDPLSLIINTDLGYAYFLARRYDQAFAQYQKVLAIDNSFVPARYDLSRYYVQMGDFDQWSKEELATLTPSQANIFRNLYSKGGFLAVMRNNAVTGGQDLMQKPPPSPFVSALSYAALGERQAALSALQQSCKQHEPGLIYLKVDPIWDSLRSAPEFQAVEKQMGLL